MENPGSDDDRSMVDRREAEILVKTLVHEHSKLIIEPFRLQVDLSGSIDDVKASIEKKLGNPKRQQVLAFNKERLDSDSILSECGIEEGATLHLVLLSPVRTTPEEKQALYGNGVTEDDLQEPMKRWSNYSQKALWFALGIIVGYMAGASKKIRGPRAKQ